MISMQLRTATAAIVGLSCLFTASMAAAQTTLCPSIIRQFQGQSEAGDGCPDMTVRLDIRSVPGPFDSRDVCHVTGTARYVNQRRDICARLEKNAAQKLKLEGTARNPHSKDEDGLVGFFLFDRSCGIRLNISTERGTCTLIVR